MSAGAQTVKIFAKSEFFDLKLFPKSVFKKFGGGAPPPPHPPPGRLWGDNRGASPPTTTGKGKSKAKANSHTPTGRRINLNIA